MDEPHATRAPSPQHPGRGGGHMTHYRSPSPRARGLQQSSPRSRLRPPRSSSSNNHNSDDNGRRQSPGGWQRVRSQAGKHFSTIGQGYSRLRSFVGGVAFLSGILLALQRFDKVHEQLAGIDEECRHAAVVVFQLDALLHRTAAHRGRGHDNNTDDDDGAGFHLGSDREGRALYRRLAKTRDDMATAISELRAALARYGPEEPSLLAKVKFHLRDNNKISSNREQLRRDLGRLDDLMVWVNR